MSNKQIKQFNEQATLASADMLLMQDGSTNETKKVLASSVQNYNYNTSRANSTWTPTCATLTLGNGTLSGNYNRVGGIVFYDFELVFGSTTSITGGGFTFSPPVTPSTRVSSANYKMPVGNANIYDASAGNFEPGFVYYTTGVFIILPYKADSTWLYTVNSISSTVPFTFTTSDYIYVSGWYWV